MDKIKQWAKWEYFESVLDQTITFSSDELLELCNAYVQITSIHRVELAMIFTRYFPSRKEPYTLKEIINVYTNNDGLRLSWIFKRFNLGQISDKSLKEILEDIDPDGKVLNEIEALRMKEMLVGSAFYGCIAENSFEFDVIPIVISSFLSIMVDVALELSVKCYDTAGSFIKSSQVEPGYRSDLAYFFNLYKLGTGNKKAFSKVLKDRYKAVKVFKTPDRDKIAQLYMIGGSELVFLKDNIVYYYLTILKNGFTMWREHVESLFVSFVLVVIPKIWAFFEMVDIETVNNEKNALAKLVGVLFNNICNDKVRYEHLRNKLRKTGAPSISRASSVCDYCEVFHKNLMLKQKEIINMPGLSMIIAACNDERKRKLECLKGYYTLGSFGKPKSFSLFLQSSLKQFGAVEKIFNNEDTYRMFSAVYNRGLLRFFWKDETLTRIKPIYDEFNQKCEEGGAPALFSFNDNGSPRIEFEQIEVSTPNGIRPFRQLRYKPKRAKENYEALLKTMFGSKELIDLNDEIKVETCQILPLMMFFYWIYLARYSKHAKDIREFSSCVFHEELVQ